MRISDWSSDVCSSDLVDQHRRIARNLAQQRREIAQRVAPQQRVLAVQQDGGLHLLEAGGEVVVPEQRHHLGERRRRRQHLAQPPGLEVESLLAQREAQRKALRLPHLGKARRSEEHTSELQSLMRISYAVFCLKKKNISANINKRSYDYT